MPPESSIDAAASSNGVGGPGEVLDVASNADPTLFEGAAGMKSREIDACKRTAPPSSTAAWAAASLRGSRRTRLATR